MQTLTDEQINLLAPSVFGTAPLSKVSNKYRFIPTSEVLTGMRDAGFRPIKAQQTHARLEERTLTNRHTLRFHHDDISPNDKGEVPEVVLFNSHNASSSYRLMFGIFRIVCSNGLIVMSENSSEVKVRHAGNVVEDVIEESLKMLEKAPTVFKQIDQWKDIPLDEDEQTAFGMLARAARPGAIDIGVEGLLEARRPEDATDEDGTRSLWKTMNVAQENIIRGGLIYKDANNNHRTTRAVKAVHADEIINRRLWQITEDFAEGQLVA